MWAIKGDEFTLADQLITKSKTTTTTNKRTQMTKKLNVNTKRKSTVIVPAM